MYNRASADAQGRPWDPARVGIRWDGQKWVTISDWVHPDRAVLRPIIEASAAKYAKEKGIKPRNCSLEAHASR